MVENRATQEQYQAHVIATHRPINHLLYNWEVIKLSNNEPGGRRLASSIGNPGSR